MEPERLWLANPRHLRWDYAGSPTRWAWAAESGAESRAEQRAERRAQQGRRHCRLSHRCRSARHLLLAQQPRPTYSICSRQRQRHGWEPTRLRPAQSRVEQSGVEQQTVEGRAQRSWTAILQRSCCSREGERTGSESREQRAEGSGQRAEGRAQQGAAGRSRAQREAHDDAATSQLAAARLQRDHDVRDFQNAARAPRPCTSERVPRRA